MLLRKNVSPTWMLAFVGQYFYFYLFLKVLSDILKIGIIRYFLQISCFVWVMKSVHLTSTLTYIRASNTAQFRAFKKCASDHFPKKNPTLICHLHEILITDWGFFFQNRRVVPTRTRVYYCDRPWAYMTTRSAPAATTTWAKTSLTNLAPARQPCPNWAEATTPPHRGWRR